MLLPVVELEEQLAVIYQVVLGDMAPENEPIEEGRDGVRIFRLNAAPMRTRLLSQALLLARPRHTLVCRKRRPVRE